MKLVVAVDTQGVESSRLGRKPHCNRIMVSIRSGGSSQYYMHIFRFLVPSFLCELSDQLIKRPRLVNISMYNYPIMRAYDV